MNEWRTEGRNAGQEQQKRCRTTGAGARKAWGLQMATLLGAVRNGLGPETAWHTKGGALLGN